MLSNAEGICPDTVQESPSWFFWAAVAWFIGLRIADSPVSHLSLSFEEVATVLGVWLVVLWACRFLQFENPWNRALWFSLCLAICLSAGWLQGLRANPPIVPKNAGIKRTPHVWALRLQKSYRLGFPSQPLQAEAKVLDVWHWDSKKGFQTSSDLNGLRNQMVQLQIAPEGFHWLGGGILWAGQDLRVWGDLRQPRTFANPGSRDVEKKFRDRNWAGKVVVRKGPVFVLPLYRIFRLQSRIDALRFFLDERIRLRLPEIEAAQVSALLLGLRTAVYYQKSQLFVQTGISHVFAISGLHVGILLICTHSVLTILFRRNRWLNARVLPEVLAFWFHVPLLLIFPLFAGGSASVFRASWMAGFYLLARGLYRSIQPFNIVGIVALITMFKDPAIIWDRSWQLSFAALLGILTGIRWFPRRCRSPVPRVPGDETTPVLDATPTAHRIGRYLGGIFWVSLWAILATFPLVIYHFQAFSTLSILSNWLVLPIMTLGILPALFLSVPVFFIESTAAEFLWLFAAWLLHLLRILLELLRTVPFSFLELSKSNLSWVLGVFSAMVTLAWAARKIKWWKVAGFSLVFLAFIVLGFFYWNGQRQEDLWIEFLDVGHGDAICVHLPGGKVLLVDGGGFVGSSFDLGKEVWRPYLRSRGIKSIDIVLVTHPDPDHYLGFVSLLQEIPVREVWFNGQYRGARQWRDFLATLQEKGVPLKVVGLETAEQKWGPVILTFLSPPKEWLDGRNDPSFNNQSVVILLKAFNESVLLTGDIEKAAEKVMVKRWQNQNRSSLSLLKVPHHGSRTSSSTAFLQALKPRVAIVSSGWLGRHHFPHPRIAERFREHQIPLFTTELCGALRAYISPENGLRIESFRNNCNWPLQANSKEPFLGKRK